jgi:hypothetical protein
MEKREGYEFQSGLVKKQISDFSRHFYVCGPDPMVAELIAGIQKALLHQTGWFLKNEHLRLPPFLPAAESWVNEPSPSNSVLIDYVFLPVFFFCLTGWLKELCSR